MTSVANVSATPLPPMAELARRWAEEYARRAEYLLEWGVYNNAVPGHASDQ